MKRKPWPVWHLSFVLLILVFSSCRKNLKSKDEIQLNSGQSQALIPTFPLTWEGADYMPTPSGNPILVPWASGSNQQFDSDIAFDYRQIDGWVLVYNTFNTTALTSPNYFALYNKFRGLLRIYLYLPPGPPVPTSYINHGLSLTGSANSSLLNYISSDLVDMNSNVTTTTNIEPYRVQASGSWYAFQYELAYDPNISNLSYQNLNLRWNTTATSVTQVNLYGTISGEIKGTITQPASTPTLEGAAQALTLGGFRYLSLTTLLNPLTTAASLGLSPGVFAALKGSATNYFQGGKISNIFNAVFGGGGGSTQQINLTLNANIGLEGTMTNISGLVGNHTLIIPGINFDSNAPGYGPAYNQKLGVFNLSAKPKVTVKTTKIRLGDRGGGTRYIKEFAIDALSYSIINNPVVTAEASISNLKQEIVLVEPSHLGSVSLSTDGTLESVGSYTKVYTNVTRYTTDKGLEPTFLAVGIRVSFDVTPNNGSPKVTIVKTFKVDLIPI